MTRDDLPEDFWANADLVDPKRRIRVKVPKLANVSIDEWLQHARIVVELETLPEGVVLGTSPDLPGLVVQADTADEVLGVGAAPGARLTHQAAAVGPAGVVSRPRPGVAAPAPPPHPLTRHRPMR